MPALSIVHPDRPWPITVRLGMWLKRRHSAGPSLGISGGLRAAGPVRGLVPAKEKTP
jgi:hypothetical protein